MPPSADFAPVRFSTRDLPERHRLEAWREEFGRSIVCVDIEPVSPDVAFHARATLQVLPGVRSASYAGSAVRFDRTRAMASHGEASIALLVNRGRDAVVEQRGEAVAVGAGDAIPILTDAAGSLTGTHHLGFLLPRAALAARVIDIDSAVMRPIPQAAEPLRLLVSYLKLVWGEAALATPAVRQSVVAHIQDLAALAIGANRETRSTAVSAVGAARLAAALAHIDESFAEPDLVVAMVARRQGISSRYLQQLLEVAGTSFTARVNELRLQKAFALLNERGGGKRRISEIALQAGFSDVSHFNRLFRARFGDSPRGVRRSGDAER
jgi:AraC-like DNA-binding protein